MRRSARIAGDKITVAPEDASTKDASTAESVGLSSLSDELLVMIFGHLPALDVFHCQLTCKRFFEIGLDEQVWKAVYHRQIGPHARRKLLPDEKYPTFSWFDHYLLCHSWRYGRCSNYKVQFSADTEYGIPTYVYLKGWAFMVIHDTDNDIPWHLSTWHVDAQTGSSEMYLRKGLDGWLGPDLDTVLICENRTDPNILCLLISWKDGIVETYYHDMQRKETKRNVQANILDKLPFRDDSTRIVAYDHPFVVCCANNPENQALRLFCLEISEISPWKCLQVAISTPDSKVLAAQIRQTTPKVTFSVVWAVPVTTESQRFRVEEYNVDLNKGQLTSKEFDYPDSNIFPCNPDAPNFRMELKYPWILYTGAENHCFVWQFEDTDREGEAMIGARYKIMSDLPLGDISCDDRGTLRFLIRPDSLKYHVWHLGGLYPPRTEYELSYEFVMGRLDKQSGQVDSQPLPKPKKQKVKHQEQDDQETQPPGKRTDPWWWVENQDEGGREADKIYTRIDDRDFVAEERKEDTRFSLAMQGTIVFDDERIMRMSFDDETRMYQLRVNDFADVVKWYYPERVRTKGSKPERA